MLPGFIPFGAGGIGGNDGFTKTLLHLDGADASTTITDSNAGGAAKTWTVGGNGQIDTAQSKFGGASLLCDGTGDFVDTPDHADFDVASGTFTVDFWFNRNGGDGTRRFLFGQSDSTGAISTQGLSAELTAANVVSGIVSDGTAVVTVTGTTAFTTTGWRHVAFVRTGNTLKLFVNGTQEGGDVAYAVAVNNSASRFAVGRVGELTTLTWFGWIDEFRFSKGVARWTANFTPPTEPYS